MRKRKLHLEIGQECKSEAQDLSIPAVNRRKKSAATRIGRACDRCQHRKLACDPAPEGCPTCIRVDAWCTATDPLTGNPTYRGEFEYLERLVAKQRAQIEELLTTVRSLGGDTTANQAEDPDTKKYLAWSQVKASGDTRPWDHDERQPHASHAQGPQQAQNGGPINNSQEMPTNDLSLPPGLPDLRTGLAGENYLGVSADDPSQRSNPGSKLNMLGWEIDIAGLSATGRNGSDHAQGPTGHVYDRSYQSFIASAFGVGLKIQGVELPSRQQALGYATAYICVLNGFLPILHKPSFMKLLKRIYDDPNFQSSAGEKVTVHMMFAQMLYQDSLRNWENPDRRQDLQVGSDRHYHFSLGHFAQLMAGHSPEDMQALAMICAHLCTFPKPETGWVVTCMAFNKAVELGYHKAIRPESPSSQRKSVLELEMRKRTFWSLMAIHVTISGKLGRPMPIREEDYDVGFPLAVDDDLLLDTGLDTSRKGRCAFLAGTEAFKVEPIFMDLYRSMYAAKRLPREYTQFISVAEKRINAWQDQWPRELCEGSPMDDIDRVSSLYLRLWKHEFRLLLHHPSLSLTQSIQINESNLRICLEVAHDMVMDVRQLQQLKSLNTTWTNCAVYILAIQTTLYGYGQMKNELTAEMFRALKQDMGLWQSIMGDIGGMLGTGRRLQDAISEQINIGLLQLEQRRPDMNSTTASDKILLVPCSRDTRNGSEQVSLDHAIPPQNDVYHSHNGYGPYGGLSQSHQYEHDNRVEATATTNNANNVYPSMAGYNYPEPSHSQYPTPINSTASFSQTPYSMSLAAQALSSDYHSQLSHGAPENRSGMYTPSTSNFSNSAYGPDSHSWFQYTQTIPNSIGPQDYNPASALLQLGGRTDQILNAASAAGEASAFYDTSAMSGGAGQMWPLGLGDHRQSLP